MRFGYHAADIIHDSVARTLVYSLLKAGHDCGIVVTRQLRHLSQCRRHHAAVKLQSHGIIVDGIGIVAHHAVDRRTAHIRHGMRGIQFHSPCTQLLGSGYVALFDGHTRQSELSLLAAWIELLESLVASLGCGIIPLFKFEIAYLVHRGIIIGGVCQSLPVIG